MKRILWFILILLLATQVFGVGIRNNTGVTKTYLGLNYVLKAGDTMTGSLSFSGVTNDLTTATSENLRLIPNNACTIVGSGSATANTDTSNDLLVSNNLDVIGTGYFGGISATNDILAGGSVVPATLRLAAGGSATTTSNGHFLVDPNGTGKVSIEASTTIHGTLEGLSTATFFNIITPGASFTKFGTGTPVIVSGGDGQVYFTGVTENASDSYQYGVLRVLGGARFYDDRMLGFGTSNDVQFLYGSAQTPNSLVLGLSTDSNGIIITTSENKLFPYAHALQSHPTIWLQSGNSVSTEALAISYTGLKAETTGKVVRIESLLLVSPEATCPIATGTQEGTVWYSATDHHFNVWNGTAWTQLDN